MPMGDGEWLAGVERCGCLAGMGTDVRLWVYGVGVDSSNGAGNRRPVTTR